MSGAPPAFPRPGSNTADRPRYAEPARSEAGRVWINADRYFEGVSPEAWNFAICGYRPAQRWLQDRKGRALSFDDIAHSSHRGAWWLGQSRENTRYNTNGY